MLHTTLDIMRALIAVVSWLNLGLRAGDECPPLRSAQVVDLYRFFLHVRIPSRGKNGWNGVMLRYSAPCRALHALLRTNVPSRTLWRPVTPCSSNSFILHCFTEYCFILLLYIALLHRVHVLLHIVLY